MGLNFSALIRYGGPFGDTLQAISQLDRNESDPVLSAVLACGQRNGFAFAEQCQLTAFWRAQADYELTLQGRPELPSLDACLDLPSDFSLTFGQDTVGVDHSLRWISFVTETEWQRVMLAAIGWLYELLKGSECVITNDGNPAVVAFRRGASFQDALQAADSQGEGEVARIEDLYIDMGYAEELVFIGDDGEPEAVPVWDSHGYLRFKPSTERHCQ